MSLPSQLLPCLSLTGEGEHKPQQWSELYGTPHRASATVSRTESVHMAIRSYNDAQHHQATAGHNQ